MLKWAVSRLPCHACEVPAVDTVSIEIPGERFAVCAYCLVDV